MLSARDLHGAVGRDSQIRAQEYRSDVFGEGLQAIRALCQEIFDTVAPLICGASSGTCGCSGNSHGALILSSLRL